jgi:hypothetical protein
VELPFPEVVEHVNVQPAQIGQHNLGGKTSTAAGAMPVRWARLRDDYAKLFREVGSI